MADIIGTPFDDLLFAASGDDVFGLHGDDTILGATIGSTFIAVGGSGNDVYAVSGTDNAIVLEAGSSNSDVLGVSGTTFPFDGVAHIDARHLLFTANQGADFLFVVDWMLPSNRIETWNLAGQSFSHATMQTLLSADAVSLPGINLIVSQVSLTDVFGAEFANQMNASILDGYLRGASLEQASGPPAVLAGTEGADSLDGGPGSDSIDGLGGADTIRGLDGADLVYGGAGDDDVNGNRGSDTVFGGAGADFARGGQEDDWVFGGDGDDWHVNGNIGDDVVLGGNGDDAVFGGQGADTLAGHEGADTLSGDRGDDLLFGDMIFPSLGTAEVFLFHSDGGNDTIFGFDTAGGDRIAVAANLNGTGIGAPEDILFRLSATGADTVIDLGGGNAVLVLAVAPAAFTVDQFLVV